MFRQTRQQHTHLQGEPTCLTKPVGLWAAAPACRTNHRWFLSYRCFLEEANRLCAALWKLLVVLTGDDSKCGTNHFGGLSLLRNFWNHRRWNAHSSHTSLWKAPPSICWARCSANQVNKISAYKLGHHVGNHFSGKLGVSVSITTQSYRLGERHGFRNRLITMTIGPDFREKDVRSWNGHKLNTCSMKIPEDISVHVRRVRLRLLRGSTSEERAKGDTVRFRSDTILLVTRFLNGMKRMVYELILGLT